MSRQLAAILHLLHGALCSLPGRFFSRLRIGCRRQPCLQVTLPPQGGRQLPLELRRNLVPARYSQRLFIRLSAVHVPK